MSEIEDFLEEGFVAELFAAAFIDKKILDIVLQNVKSNFLPEKFQKDLLKEIKAQYEVENKKPTLGTLTLAFRKDRGMLDYIHEIKNVELDNTETIITGLTEFIRQSQFIETYDQIGEIWNQQGDKKKCYKMFIDTAERLSNFNLNNLTFNTVFGDFNKRQTQRIVDASKHNEIISTGIDGLDRAFNGGYEAGMFVMYVADAKGGKSFLLTHHGIAAARRGFGVVHFQLEGTERMCLDRYDSNWSGTTYYDMKSGNIDASKYKSHKKIVDNLGKADIHVYAHESFKAMSVLEMRRKLIDLKKKFPNIKVVIVDYMDLANPDEQEYRPSDERFRQQKTAQALKDLSIDKELGGLLVITATQASSIDPELLNDPDFVITRRDLAEDKGKVRPVDVLISINRTKIERKNKICRLYVEAAREHSGSDTIIIKQNLAQSRFYDRVATLKEDFLEEYEEEED